MLESKTHRSLVSIAVSPAEVAETFLGLQNSRYQYLRNQTPITSIRNTLKSARVVPEAYRQTDRPTATLILIVSSVP